MNKAGRAHLATQLAALEDIKAELEGAASDEREKYDSMPEGLQNGDRGQQMSTNADALDAAVSSLEEAINSLGEVE